MGLAEANAYFAARLNTGAWDSASSTDKTKALAQAARELEPYEDLVDSTQYTYAVYEQALWLIQGDRRSELQQAGVVSASIGDVSESYRTRRDPNVAPRAWMYLRGRRPRVGELW